MQWGCSGACLTMPSLHAIDEPDPPDAAALAGELPAGFSDETLNALAALAALICRCPMAVVRLEGSARQWFKADAGIAYTQVQQVLAFCAHVPADRPRPVVTPAGRNAVLLSPPLGRGEFPVRFHACVPLAVPGGATLGTLAVVDTVSRTLEQAQIDGLTLLAEQTMAQWQLHRERQRAQQDWRESEERFQLVSRATADAVWDWNLLTDEMWWNEGMQSLFGVPLDELPPDSTSWTQRLHPQDKDETVHSVYAVIDGVASHWTGEYRFLRQDGSYAWVHDRGFVIRDGTGRALRMVGAMADISVQKLVDIDAQRDAQNHAELLQVQQRISSIELPLPEALQLVADTVLRQTEASGALVELLHDGQLVAQAAAGDHVRPVGHLLPVDKSLLWPALSEGRTVVCNDTDAEGWDMASMPHRYGVRSVMAVPLRTAQGVVGSLKVTSDKPQAFSRRNVAHLEILTESLGSMVQLRHVAAQLRASEQQYRMLFDEHPHPMWVYDEETLRLQAVNQSMETHYGYSEAELLALDLPELWPPDCRAGAGATMDAILAGHRHRPVICRHRKKDGSLMDLEITAGRISFNGRPARQVLAADVTDRLRTERELARMGRAQRLLSACNETLARATSETALLQAICQIAVDIGGYRLGWVGFALDDERKSIQPVAHAGYNQNYLDHLQLSWSEDDVYGRGPAGMAVRSGQPVIVQDIRTEGDFADWTERMLDHGFHGVICLPL